MISRRVWTINSDGTLTLELMALNPESSCSASKVATISHGPSVRHMIPRDFGPPTNDELFRYEFAAPLGT
jgi:hypothetical protein